MVVYIIYNVMVVYDVIHPCRLLFFINQGHAPHWKRFQLTTGQVLQRNLC